MRQKSLDDPFDDMLIGLAEDDAPVHPGILLSEVALPASPEAAAMLDAAAPLPADDDGSAVPTFDFCGDGAWRWPGGSFAAIADGSASAMAPAATEIDAAQILRDRPDVYAAFYAEYFGPNNDRNSPAWAERVGGTTPEDYARYWYKTYGQPSGYEPRASSGSAAPTEEGAYSGRTTIDGIPLSKILSDRPDVFQAFFTEYYGPNNDRRSDAWTERVGGTTVEDYANYWYNAYGKVSGYTPSGSSVANPEPAGEDQPPQPIPEEPAADDGHAVEPPMEVVIDGEDSNAEPIDFAYALPLVVHHTETGVELVPMSAAEFIRLQATSLFEDPLL